MALHSLVKTFLYNKLLLLISHSSSMGPKSGTLSYSNRSFELIKDIPLGIPHERLPFWWPLRLLCISELVVLSCKEAFLVLYRKKMVPRPVGGEQSQTSP